MDRRRRNVLVVNERVQTLDPKTIRVPGVGDVALREALPAEFKVRSVTLTESTPPARGGRVRPEERSWEIRLTTRVPAPLRGLPATPVTAGCDHGVKHALTVSTSDGTSEHLHYKVPEATRSRRYDRLQKRKERCRRRRRPSRRRRALQRQQNRLRRRALGQRAEQRRQWANRIALGNDLVGIEHLRIANMTRSARGSLLQPGRNVRAKSGLNRRLAESCPGYQTTELKQACIRHGTRYQLIPAAGTSITCAECGHRDPKSRESQGVFRCRGCQHEANADVNAGHTVRLLAEAETRVGVSRSWAIKQVARSAEAARREARRARGDRTARRSTTPETRTPKPAAGRQEAAQHRP